MPLPAALLFDMDGTLVDTEPIWHVAEQRILASYGKVWTPEFGESMLGGPLDRAAQVMATQAEEPRVDVMEELLVTSMVALLESSPITWMPGARDLVTAAAELEVPCALVSNSYRSLMNAVLVALLDDLGSLPFETTVTADEVRAGKPDPEPFRVAAARLEARPEDCVVFEDSAVGVAAGLASGARVVAVPSAGPLDPHPRLVVLESLTGVTPGGLDALFQA